MTLVLHFWVAGEEIGAQPYLAALPEIPLSLAHHGIPAGTCAQTHHGRGRTGDDLDKNRTPGGPGATPSAAGAGCEATE